MPHDLINRAGPAPVALETTLLAHGVPRGSAAGLAADLTADVEQAGATAATIGVLEGRPIVGMNDNELAQLLQAEPTKANTSNLGLLLASGASAATTVSTTMELASAAGVRVFATGGLGGVHLGYGRRLDVSSDLMAFSRFGVAVVTSGVKSLLDVESTREALETLGVPVVGWACDSFPAFYIRQSDAEVDARFDDIDELARFVAAELARTGRGIVVCNPIPDSDEMPRDEWESLLERAAQEAVDQGVSGRGVTPFVLGRLHELSEGRTLKANIALVRSNARLAGKLAAAMRAIEEGAPA